MNTVQRIAKNTGVFFSAQIIAFILAFFYTIYSARYLGPDGFGILSFALSLVLIFGIFTDLGLSTLLTREVSRDKSIQNKYVGNFLLIKIILSILSLGGLMIFVFSADYSYQFLNVIFIIGLYMVANTFSQLFFALFQAYEKLEYHALSFLINNFLILVGVLYGISNGLDVTWFALVYLLVSLIVLIYSVVISKWKFSLPGFIFDLDFWKKSLKLALPLTIAVIFSTIAFRVDAVLLGLLKGNIPVGWYSASFKVIEFSMFIPTVYAGAIYPVLSNFYVSSKESLQVIYEKSFKYLFFIALPIAAATTILANDIILILYQNSYNESILALQILVWAVPFLFLSSIFSVVLISINKPNILVKTTLISMLFNIIMNLLLIPTYSYIGASIIALITSALSACACFYYLSKFNYKIHISNVIFKPVISTILMVFLIIIINLNFYLSILFGFIFYFGLLIIFKAFSEDDLVIFKKLFEG